MRLIHPLVPMDIQRHVFDTPGNSGLKMVANRYKILPYTEETGLTLLLTHCIGGRESFLTALFLKFDFENSPSDKEQWEPVIESIVETQCTKNRNRRIREVWAFDWQSHGDSAVLNHDILNDRRNGVCKLHFPLKESHNNSAEKIPNSCLRVDCSIDILSAIPPCEGPSRYCYRPFSRSRRDVSITITPNLLP